MEEMFERVDNSETNPPIEPAQAHYKGLLVIMSVIIKTICTGSRAKSLLEYRAGDEMSRHASVSWPLHAGVRSMVSNTWNHFGALERDSAINEICSVPNNILLALRDVFAILRRSLFIACFTF